MNDDTANLLTIADIEARHRRFGDRPTMRLMRDAARACGVMRGIADGLDEDGGLPITSARLRKYAEALWIAITDMSAQIDNEGGIE